MTRRTQKQIEEDLYRAIQGPGGVILSEGTWLYCVSKPVSEKTWIRCMVKMNNQGLVKIGRDPAGGCFVRVLTPHEIVANKNKIIPMNEEQLQLWIMT